jgi:hypothetical protein
MVRFFSSILLVFSLVGCSPPPPEAPRSSFSIDDLNRLFPSAMNWYEQTEQRFGATGRQLTEAELQQAHILGIVHPERVRVVTQEHFPLPDQPELRAAALQLGIGARPESGRTMGNLIFLKPDLAADSPVLTHELVHIGQQERLGRRQFVYTILYELATVGYAKSPLEVEAYKRQRPMAH